MGKKPEIFSTAKIEKRNILNELRNNNMTLQELRFFSIYLSKINARDISTRKVRFPLSDFQKIMGIGADMNIPHFRVVVRRLLQQIVEIPNENGCGYTAFQLFKECVVDQDESGEWYVEIDAHDKALPLMFDFKDRYFTYELWNALKLKSAHQIRMYEILKQYEKVGKRELSVTELRNLLGIAPDEYSRWERFRTRVLDSCQQALAENTDICYTYERGKMGRGGKWLTIVFYIHKNKNHIDSLKLDDFIESQPELEPEKPKLKEIDYGSGLCSTIGKAYGSKLKLSSEQVHEIADTVVEILPSEDDESRFNYLSEQVKKMEGRQITDRFAYLCKILKKELEKENMSQSDFAIGEAVYEADESEIEEVESFSNLDSLFGELKNTIKANEYDFTDEQIRTIASELKCVFPDEDDVINLCEILIDEVIPKADPCAPDMYEQVLKQIEEAKGA